MYVCSCTGITDHQVKQVVVAGACSVDEVTRACGAGGGCGGCHELLARLLSQPAPRAMGEESAAVL
jgi:bacterioferritin-associated ferredoxin